jgi:hypothetical protein
MLVLEPDHVLAVSGHNVALHKRWSPDDPPRIVDEKIADLSTDQVSALLWQLQHWGAEARQARGNGRGIFLDW